MLVLIDNYDSFTHNLVQTFGALGMPPLVVRNDSLAVTELQAMPLTGLVVSPGPGRPEDAGISMAAIRCFLGQIPILGVCLGHQCLAMVFGARVVRGHPLHGRASAIHHDGRDLFANIPSPFLGARYHSLVVDPASVTPPALEIRAHAEDGAVMALAAPAWNAFGVQFHPESFLTEYGCLLVSNFISLVGTCATSPMP